MPVAEHDPSVPRGTLKYTRKTFERRSAEGAAEGPARVDIGPHVLANTCSFAVIAMREAPGKVQESLRCAVNNLRSHIRRCRAPPAGRGSPRRGAVTRTLLFEVSCGGLTVTLIPGPIQPQQGILCTSLLKGPSKSRCDLSETLTAMPGRPTLGHLCLAALALIMLDSENTTTIIQLSPS
ncbi:hypothetical protein E2C01_054418 [Portunus trituberculatus]|uniref:Uncharacterized protein n=1 Tax=Portunus trituberculatus TaxID=210409 RepID=A0A5B7GUY9_PORTR|nr:hypothetical protein [Portunus trituberculatus]